MLVQAPRLTGSLRDSPFDADQAYRNRKDLLQTLRPPRTHDDSELARKLVPQWDEASSEIRQTFRQFLGSVVELMNGEVVDGELQDVAKTIYDMFAGIDSDLDVSSTAIFQRKKELQKVVGCHVSDSNLKKVSSLATTLCYMQSDGSETVLTSKDVSNGHLQEFGSDLHFEAPDRFVVNASLGNGTSSLNDNYSNVSLLQDKQFNHFGSKSHHSDFSGGIINLRLLKNACEQVVRGRGSQLSADELAFALCRVLNSNRAGDEVPFVF